MAEESSSTGTEFFIFSGFVAFVHLQNQKSVNAATNTSFWFTARKRLGVKRTSADQAVVKSGTSLSCQNLSFSSTHLQPALINLPKLCLLRIAYGTVLQPCAAQQTHFLSLLRAFGTGNFKLNKLLILEQQSLNSNHFWSPFSNWLVPSQDVHVE